MKVVVDAFGGDYSPTEIIKGAVNALNVKQDFEIVLCGDKIKIENCLNKIGNFDKTRMEILDAPDIITNDDIPTVAVRKKKNSSLIAGLNFLNDDPEAKGFVSAGSTGAVLTGAVLILKRIKGINRSALCPVLPTVKNKNVLLIDCGANTEPKPMNLLQFAFMGTAYSKSILHIENPTVGLLSNGTEDKKGNALNKEAFELLKDSANVNFIGNIEGRDILTGDVDIVVCDGFSGNVALKSCEGTALAMFSMIKTGIVNGGLRAKLGYLLLKPVFKNIKHTLDYNDNGGAVLLGMEKIVVKAHGSSKAKAIQNSILQVVKLYEDNIIQSIENELQ